MTIEKITELLQIKKYSGISIEIDLKNQAINIVDLTIPTDLRDLIVELKDKEFSLEFRRCIFENIFTFSVEPTKRKISFKDCTFQKFVSARGCIFEKEFECTFCSFQDRVDFSKTIFKSLVKFEVSRFENEARFNQARFQAQADDNVIENSFAEVHFGNSTSFNMAIFAGKVDFSISIFKGETTFGQAKFLAPNTNGAIIENSFKEAKFKNKVSFDRTEFAGRVDFSLSKFKDETRFVDTEFQAQSTDNENIINNFREAQFEESVFNSIKFKGRTDCQKTKFKNSIFQKVIFAQDEIFFWESMFEKVSFTDCRLPIQSDFAKCIFKNTLFQNRIYKNTMMQMARFQDCTFKEANTFGEKVFLHRPLLVENTFEGQFNIDHQYLCYKIEEIPREHISLWRDLFRRLKSNRLAHHNVIDASELHTQELYARELEIKEKEKQEKISFKEKIEKWQLWFYRLTSDHHTDLAKIFNNVIMLIALFGIFAFGLDSLANHNFSTPKPSQKFIFGMLSKTPNSVAFWSLGLLLGVGILTEIRNIAKTYLKGIFLPFLWRSIPSMVLLLILCVLMCESFALLPLWLQETILIFGVCSSFVGIYLFLLWRESRVWIAISYVVSLGILLFKPSLLLPFVGQLFDEGLKANFSAMQSLSVVYCILMFLMLFSLQKTARKNSIIPS